MWKAVVGAAAVALTSTTDAWAAPEVCVGDCADEVGLLQRKTTNAKLGTHGAASNSGEESDAGAKKAGDKEEGDRITHTENDDDTFSSPFSDSADEQAAEVYTEDSVLVVPAFTKNQGYVGDLHPAGHVEVLGRGVGIDAAQVLNWDLTGVDPKCTQGLFDGSEEGPPTACVITINEGRSCADAGDASPSIGKSVRYVAGPPDGSKGTATLRTGRDNSRIDGHSMLIRDHRGVAVGCGVVQARSLGVKAFTPYFDYTGSLNVSGWVDVKGQGVAEGASQDVRWSLHETDPRCFNGAHASTKNSCGAHIHVGMSCAEDAGGHYWNTGAIGADPWAPVGYKSFFNLFHQMIALNIGGRVVNTAVNMWDVSGRTLIVHDYEGKRVACGIIQAPRGIANAFIRYFQYTGALGPPLGHIAVEGSGILRSAAQTISWKLDHVDMRCNGIASAYTSPNSCGIHIHQGTSCEQDAGPHFYNESLVGPDPWTAVHYVADRVQGHEQVEWATEGRAKVTTGYNMKDAVGHSMIVHNWEGTKVSCGIVVIAEHTERHGAGLTA